MANKPAQLIDALGSEILTTVRAFYIWKDVNNLAASNMAIFQGLNRNALSWNTMLGGLQTTYLILLGRLFDADPGALSVHSVLNSCIEHIEDFSAESLRQRKISDNMGVRPDWLEDFVSAAYVPTKRDFGELKIAVKPHKAKYLEAFQAIRHQFIAHREIAVLHDADAIFGRATLKDIEGALISLHRVHRCLWNLLHNGQKTSLEDINLVEPEYVKRDLEDLLSKIKHVPSQ